MSEPLMNHLSRCKRLNSNGLPCGDYELTWTHSMCAKTHRGFCDTETCHQFAGDLPVAKSPAVPSSGAPEPPARQTSIGDEVHGGTQATPGLRLSSKHQIVMEVTGTWMEHGRIVKHVIRFVADGANEDSTMLFGIERAINQTACLRAHVTEEV